MHDEILSGEQKKLLPLVKKFFSEFGLVGDTAIALHLGHRRSIDFDLFVEVDFDSGKIRNLIRQTHKLQKVFVDNPGELTILIDGVKLTFYKYPFNIVFSQSFEEFIKIPDLLTLASMKAFALGKRAKWKDYVDLAFIFKQLPLKDVVKKSEELFGGEFNEKLFRQQLSYFEDLDYSEEVDYMPGFSVNDKEIQKNLVKAYILS